MVLCKNAQEYWRELWRLRGEGFNEYYSKKTKLHAKFHSIDDPTNEDIKKHRNDVHDLFYNCLKEALDFEKQQPTKPLFIYKKGRKYHELKFTLESPNLWISPKPIDEQTLREKSNAWILPIHFDGLPVDVVVCDSCKKDFVRHKPHQKNCPSCQDNLKIGFDPFTEPDKHRYCLHCGKHLPNGIHGKRKYCCGACRQAAFKRRKEAIISPVDSA